MKGRNRRRTASKHHHVNKKPLATVIICTVCRKGDGKYKCPKCRAPFCCVQCSKDHKANHCPATTKTSTITESTTDVNLSCTSTTTEQQSKYLSTKELQSTSQPRRKRIRPFKSSEESDDDDDEPGWKITDEMKQKLYQSKWLHKELQDGGLRKLIENIDTASDVEEDYVDDNCNNRRQQSQRHRGGNNKSNNNTNNTISSREFALARTKHAHPKFKSFIDEMLLTAGVLQPADNGIGGEEGGGTTTLSRILQGEPSHGPLVLAPVPRRGGVHTNDTNGSVKSNDDDGCSSSSSSSNDSDEESDDSSGSSDSSSEDSGDEKQK